ncbi:MAG: 1-deoxy-D-xylulose-5-phosphate reductoisomerase [Candidatus Marinimicrobia bacterium]|nr:1-deoxy-D-xylulose-5-phosphate reductoisomerase [Candidatus Neomarinimicrobiota bacterium]
MRALTILGSTGSIGTQTLEVVENLPGEFRVVALTANRNIELLAHQARQFQVEAVALADPTGADELRERLAGSGIAIHTGRAGLLEIAGRDDIDLCLNGLVGGGGMAPTMAALEAGVDVALSNKESLVMAGALITALQQEKGTRLLPIDSEHSAIWQCLAGEDRSQIRRLVLTGSGGPFRTWPLEDMSQVTREQALRHPNWDMGPKVTIDSATMMNKGLEVIEARWLYDMPPERIDIVIHPQSIIHSMVEFVDGSIKAQLGVPDMKIPIQYALAYPDHRPADWPRLDLAAIGELTFEEPDLEKFPCITLAYDALRRGGSAPAALNLANDLAVQAFLDDQLAFAAIPRVLERVLSEHPFIETPTLADLEELEAWTERYVSKTLSSEVMA